MFEKAKKFIKDHKVEIAFAAGLASAGAASLIGAYFGKRELMKVRENANWKLINSVLTSIPDGTLVHTYGDIISGGFFPNELGELGARMIKAGIDMQNDSFTHFIAIGQEK